MDTIVWLVVALIIFVTCTLPIILDAYEKRKRGKAEIPKAVTPKALPKAKTEQEAKDDWIAAFKGEPTEGRHKITETYFSKRVMKDGSKWPSYKSDNWPVWKCACGADGTVVMHDHDYAAAEKRAVKEATRHVNDNNYVEWKNKNRLDGRAF
jgi:hypothetical protein